ncbi:MAG: hypothetical protein IAG13_03230 [Deltaproteobacteria bacterium]|nr:hypothetical protein [Nannocystaceae bacterium]
MTRLPEVEPPTPFEACIDPEVLITCETGACVEYDCWDVCAAASDAPSLGCRDGVCACSAVGTPCLPDQAARCEQGEFLVECVDDVWSVTDCRVRCAHINDPKCVYRSHETAVCLCDP